ncbi:LysM peptidoglycan-binding domain-containing M23 family metallopeptidase [Patescibacteria group bacterium]|nr:LysM peptidoglycan-binding domain-containing M23 family metallopeptidase [Patescibacteria group bacterium]
MLLTLVITVFGVTLLLIPRLAVAFWPFATTEAAVEGAGSPILHDTRIALLDAATHSDPNPSKGNSDITLTGGSALMANTGVEGTVADISSSLGGGRISIYEVRPGDSLSEIASLFGVTGNTILWANDLTSASSIHPGMKLLILPVSGLNHTVVKGETLQSLAKTYGGDVDEIAAFNGIDTDSGLAIGAKVIIPGGEVAAKAPVKAKAKTVAKTVAKGPSSVVLPAISGFFGNPLPGGRLSQGIHGNNAVDISAPSGTPIYAAAGGTIIVAKGGGGWNGGYGNYIVIDHGNGTQTLYAHMSSMDMTTGTKVDKGQRIGSVGITGKATGYHLHFEVRGAKNPFGG